MITWTQNNTERSFDRLFGDFSRPYLQYHPAEVKSCSRLSITIHQICSSESAQKNFSWVGLGTPAQLFFDILMNMQHMYFPNQIAHIENFELSEVSSTLFLDSSYREISFAYFQQIFQTSSFQTSLNYQQLQYASRNILKTIFLD